MNTRKNNKIAILLGAGSSIPAGIPSTEDLTGSVLCGQGVHRSTMTTYIPNPDLAAKHKGIHPDHDNLVIISKLMSRWFCEQAQMIMEKYNKRANYEDIFYLVDQVYADEWEIENPAIYHFVNETKEKIASVYSQIYLGRHLDNSKLYSILGEIRNYVADIVWHKLSCNSQNTDHLKIWKYICTNFDVSCIATLCHDTHVETFLADQCISLMDGFCPDPEVGVRYWNGSFISKGTIPFIKIHGSVDWFKFCPDNGGNARIGIPLNGDAEHTRTQDGILQNPLNGGRPLMLIGTFNKMYDYSRDIFLDLFYQLRLSLKKADIMIICGYSFGDKGINGEISNWYHTNPDCRHFIIIDPNPEQLFQNARPLIQRNWCSWIIKGSLIDKPLQDVTIQEIVTAINKCLN